eukprot:CAMPEP_0117084278 /NCGR_PEP_ID=MMETSP0472-20121206/59315_1 /TAXON_ID=693140 ORGANISM="Tiarina fusus, Strain LIS" /NCGR_SAMPLE_ID=MMETSP0472 /ASSEMBLY_ACC=CAM_ASM_000603 /LENGTH=45 /DNA_ID= /DNA_START= /DNA_END= /DNA_ORIENTATION=
MRELLESPKLKTIHEEEKELSMWNILKTLLPVVTCNEQNPSHGYL